MVRHALVALDDSDPAWEAFSYALSAFEGERLTLLHVVDPMEGVYAGPDGGYADQETRERVQERARLLCDRARDRAAELGALETTVVETAIESGRPARTIVEYAEEHDVDHVVVGSHGRSGVSRILLGSVAEAVARNSPVPVTVVR